LLITSGGEVFTISFLGVVSSLPHFSQNSLSTGIVAPQYLQNLVESLKEYAIGIVFSPAENTFHFVLWQVKVE
jgi:hypothetical protein